jgi:hypothetical protein
MNNIENINQQSVLVDLKLYQLRLAFRISNTNDSYIKHIIFTYKEKKKLKDSSL